MQILYGNGCSTGTAIMAADIKVEEPSEPYYRRVVFGVEGFTIKLWPHEVRSMARALGIIDPLPPRVPLPPKE